MDIIFIESLRVDTVIGVYDWEKKFEQPLFFDVEMQTDIHASAQKDDIDLTVNYKTVCDEITDLVKQSRYELLETLAEDICQHILKNHLGVQQLTLSIKKPQAVTQAENVGLKIIRQR